jgi:hypothetical protein
MRVYNRRIARVLALTCAAFCLSGWTDGDWGEQAATFVDTRIPELSHAIADVELRDRWERNTSTFHVGLLVVVSGVSDQLETLAIPQSPAADMSLPDLQQYVMALHAKLKLLIDLELQLENANRVIAASTQACDSNSIYAALDFNTILRMGIFAVTLPTPDYKIEASFPNPATAFISMLSAGLIADKTSKQNEIFNRAMERAASRLISEHDTFELSKATCGERRAKYTEMVGSLQTVIASQFALLQKTRDHLQALRPEAETRLLRGIAERRLKSQGLDDLLPELDAAAYTAEITTQATLIREEVAKRVAGRSTTNCAAWLAGSEDLSDYIAEAKVQTDALTTVPNADVRATALALASFLQEAAAHLQRERTTARPQICR